MSDVMYRDCEERDHQKAVKRIHNDIIIMKIIELSKYLK